MATAMICPYPLAYANTDEPHHGYTWTVFGDCVVPCPTIEYTDSEWNRLTDILIVFSAISMWMSFFSFVAHAINFQKYYIQCMFIFGFLFNSVVISAFFALNYKDNQVICDTRSHFIERGDMCVFQAASMVFSFVWVESWSVIFVYDMYLHVTYSAQAADIPQLRVKYTVVATALSLLAMLPPLLDRNLGFDPEANVPFCLNMISENRDYFWFTFFLPLCVLILFAMLFAIMSAVRMNQIFAVAAPTLQSGVARFGMYDNLMGEHEGGLSTVPRLPSESSFNQSMSLQESDMESSSNSTSEALLQSASAGGDGDEYIFRYSNAGPHTDYNDAIDTVSDSPSGSYQDKNDHCMSDEYQADPNESDLPVPVGVGADGRESLLESSAAGGYSVLSAVSGIFSTSGSASANTSAPPTANVEPGHSSPTKLRIGDGTSFGSDSMNPSRASGSQDPRTSAHNPGFVSTVIKRHLLSWLPPLWATYVEKTWKYNGLCIVFVMFFCLSSVCVAPLLYHLYQTTWQRSIDSAEVFAACLVQASLATLNPNNPDNIPQTQDAVDAYAAGICGSVPADRPNQAMVRPTGYICLLH